MDAAIAASLVMQLVGVVLVAVGIWDKYGTARRLERDAPDGSAGQRARHEAQAMKFGLGVPPGTMAIYNQREIDAYRATLPARVEAADRYAAALDHADTRERGLRATLAADLRGGLWREALGALLLVTGAVVGLLT